jgi:hypothetical protein
LKTCFNLASPLNALSMPPKKKQKCALNLPSVAAKRAQLARAEEGDSGGERENVTAVCALSIESSFF